jgi:arylsulfatase
MLGKNKTTGRDLYPFFGIDGELMSIKWKIYKTIFRYAQSPVSIQQPYVKPQIPMIYDLSSDPHEDNNLMYTDLTLGWVYAPSFKWIEQYETSVKKYPNIKVGEDFKGYSAK